MAEHGAGTLSRRDVFARGHTPAEFAWWLQAGLLERTGRGEYRVAGSDQTLKQQLATRLWRAGPGARIAGPLRVALAGVTGFVRGRWHRLDFAFRDVRLAPEYHGTSHADRREEDADRDLALTELQIQTLRITKTMMRNPEDVRRRVLAVHAHWLTLNLAPLAVVAPPWV